ncbi:NAD(P)H dehydrogenase :NADPH-dependent FMN reductase, partial [Rhizophagus irregularis]|uniref:NAD(P)H dehydrogenase:NADPH-dependent FMN reductase n=1 Tax=Rhizophagus irregularis TaxID=588596 RepID=A0A2I1DRD3_9GLOM
MSVFKIAGICGSLRKDSCNKKLLLRTQQLCSEHIKGATIEIIDWSQVPIYNQDLESNSPQSVLDFKNSLADHDAIIFSTPEYNYSIPGPLKNAIDWASRPVGDRGHVFAGKVAAIIGAAGSSGSGRAQFVLRQSLVFLDMVPVNKPLITIADAVHAFNEDGSLVDKHFENKIIKVLQNLVKLGKQLKIDPE